MAETAPVKAKKRAAEVFAQLHAQGREELAQAIKAKFGVKEKPETKQAEPEKPKTTPKPKTHLEGAANILAERQKAVEKRFGKATPKPSKPKSQREESSPSPLQMLNLLRYRPGTRLERLPGPEYPIEQLAQRFRERWREEKRLGAHSKAAAAEYLRTGTGQEVKGLVSFLRGL